MRSLCRECACRAVCGLFMTFGELNPKECRRFRLSEEKKVVPAVCSDEKI